MMDQFLEEVVGMRNKGFQTVAYILVNITWVLMAIVAFFFMNTMTQSLQMFGFGQDFILRLVLFLVFGGVAALIFLRRDRVRTEYEYTFTNGQMDFAQVFNNKKRKNLGTMNVKNVEALGLVASGSFNRYINMPGIKRSNWFVNRDAQLFYFYFSKDQQKRIIIIEASDEMIALIKRYAAQGAYQVN